MTSHAAIPSSGQALQSFPGSASCFCQARRDARYGRCQVAVVESTFLKCLQCADSLRPMAVGGGTLKLRGVRRPAAAGLVHSTKLASDCHASATATGPHMHVLTGLGALQWQRLAMRDWQVVERPEHEKTESRVVVCC